MKDESRKQNDECGLLNAEYTEETSCGFALPTAHRPLTTDHSPLFTLHFLLSTICMSYLCFAAFAARAEESDQEKAAAQWFTPAAQKAIDRGLSWLAERQHDDGSFGTGPARGNVAVCGLVGMAFMSGGSTPGRGPYGRQV